MKINTYSNLKTLTQILCGTALLGLSAQHALAEVKSLSSSELTETYIKDSTIIVTPKKQKLQTEQKTYSSLTIAPVNNIDQDLDKLEHLDKHMDAVVTAGLLDENQLRDAGVAFAIAGPTTIEGGIPDFFERNTLPMDELTGDERFAVPEGDFDRTYMGGDANSLGLSRDGDLVTFSIGNLPQIDQINLPHGIDEGPLQITPRENGGFDLTIAIPQDN